MILFHPFSTSHADAGIHVLVHNLATVASSISRDRAVLFETPSLWLFVRGFNIYSRPGLNSSPLLRPCVCCTSMICRSWPLQLMFMRLKRIRCLHLRLEWGHVMIIELRCQGLERYGWRSGSGLTPSTHSRSVTKPACVPLWSSPATGIPLLTSLALDP
jgi:hypothetical protein